MTTVNNAPTRTTSQTRSTPDRVVSTTTVRGVVSTPTADRFAGYNKTEDGVDRSLVGENNKETSATYLGLSGAVIDKPVAPVDPAKPGVNPVPVDPRVKVIKKSSILSIDALADVRLRQKTQPLPDNKVRSDNRPREDKRDFCKARPENNKPKDDKPRGSGGGGKFVPWKGTKYGC